MSVDYIGILKAMAWEQAKGQLRAMAMLSGAGQGRSPDWMKVKKTIEAFIADFESEGFHE